MPVRKKQLFWGVVGVLLLVAAGLILRIRSAPLDNDEIWEIWQTFGTPQQIIQWTSSSEYPTYMLLLGAWKGLVGFHPYILHYLSILLALPSVAFMYRAVRRLNGEWAGILAALAYAVFPFGIFTGLLVRSYVLVYTALPLALWLSSRYFERPTIKRGLLAGTTLYLMYIGNVSIIPALVLLALYLLVAYPRRIVYGLFPGAIGLLLIMPDYLTNKLQWVTNFSSGNQTTKLAPLPQAWFDFFNFFTQSPLWYLLVITAAGMAIFLLVRQQLARSQRVNLIFWLGWFSVIPVIPYILEPRLGFYPPRRYAWWYIFGVAMLVGIGLAYLPRVGRWIAVGVFVLLAFTPFRLTDYNYIITPLGDDLSWLHDNIQTGDALMLAPSLTWNFPEEWDYYTHLYFPAGLRYVNDAEGTQRVWYVSPEDDASRAFEQNLSKTRMAGRFVGPPGRLFRLFEGPPNPQGILFENGMRFHGFEVMDGDQSLNFPLVFRESQPIRVRLWWSVDQPVTLDYSVNLNLREQDKVISQTDSAPQLIYPQDAPVETSRWTPGQIYVEERTLTTPPANYRDIFDMTMAVYWFGEPSHRFSAPGEKADNSLALAKVTLVAW